MTLHLHNPMEWQFKNRSMIMILQFQFATKPLYEFFATL